SVVVKKSGYKSWERKMKVVAGSSIHLNAEMEKSANP
ncbi:MAG: PEGA domain-containing protein, partial [Acidobacteria bacterium]